MERALEASVVIVVRNDPRIADCIASVLSQDFPRDAYEIIVIDNMSSDNTPGLIRQFPVRFFSEHRIGMCWARNQGIEMARGSTIAFTDADCIVSSTWLRELLTGFDSNAVGGVGGVIVKLQEPSNIARAARDLVIGQQRVPQHLPMYPAPYIVTANAAYRVEALRAIVGFDPRFFSGGDVDIAWRLQIAGYSLNWVHGAIVYHASRTTMSAYFRQFYKYGLGHALLFKKFRTYTGRKFLFNTYPVSNLARLIFQRLPLAIVDSLGSGNKKTVWLSLGLDFVEYIALICGDIVGAIRFRVPYL